MEPVVLTVIVPPMVVLPVVVILARLIVSRLAVPDTRRLPCTEKVLPGLVVPTPIL